MRLQRKIVSKPGAFEGRLLLMMIHSYIILFLLRQFLSSIYFCFHICTKFVLFWLANATSGLNNRRTSGAMMMNKPIKSWIIHNCFIQQACGKYTACYLLADLWKAYIEQSFYGAGVPVLLGSRESIMQYYSPSLSAMQIYTYKSFDSSRLGRSSSSIFKSGSWNESHTSVMPFSSRTLDTTSDDTTIDQTIGRLGYLYYQYNETSSPYDRLPLFRKISTLAQNYHGLLNFRSVDLSPYSWVAIAWYPIYQIPFVGNVKDLAACFITYHSLSTCSQELGLPFSASGRGQMSREGRRFILNGDDGNEILLPPFAASTYKVFGDLWKNPRTSDRADIARYQNAAASWLRELRFQHNDFNFFSTR